MQLGKILFVIDRISQSGAGTEGQLLLLMNQLHQRGLCLELLVLNHSPWLDEATWLWPVKVLGTASVKNPATWYRLWRLGRSYRAKGFRLAQIFFNDASLICPPIFAACGINTFIARRDMGFWYTALYRRLLPITGRFVAGAVVNSQAVGEVTRRVEKLPASKVHVIYNGYGVDKKADLASGRAHPELVRLASEGARLIGLVANIRPIKRIGDAIAALERLNPRYPGLHLVVLGGGEPGSLLHQAKAQGLEGRVHFLGSCSDISGCLSYFEVGVLCSESEGFSNAIVEYQYAGLPVVCSETGGNPEAVIEGESGWLFPVGDIDALADRLDRLLTDPSMARAMGKRGRSQAEERYQPEAMAERYLAVYRTLD